MVECKSRGAYLMGLTGFGNYNIEDTVDFTVYIPGTDPAFYSLTCCGTPAAARVLCQCGQRTGCR